MAEKKVTTTTATDTETLVKAQNFWDKYSKPIIIAGSAIILLIAGWYGYQNFIVEPKERSANELIFPAEGLFDHMAANGFSADSAAIVLNGGDLEGRRVTGILKIISDHGGTKAGNRANYIAGATYLHIRQYDKAIKYLKEFDGNGAHQVQSKAYILLGHAYAEQNKTGEALDFYTKAARVNKEDETITPDALLIAASYADATGKSKEAIELYTELRDNYPASASVKSGDVDKFLAKLGSLK